MFTKPLIQPFVSDAGAAPEGASARLVLGLGVMTLSLLIRFSAAGFLLSHWRSGQAVALAGIIYATGKALFYLGLFLAGPAALKRYPWLRPQNWRKRRRIGAETPDAVRC